MFKRAKIIFLGDTAVGKSCIICALNNHPINTLHEVIDVRFQPTIGMDFSIKILNGENGEYKVQLWDTAGQEKFKSIMPSYIRNARIAVIVYDVTSNCNLMGRHAFISQPRKMEVTVRGKLSKGSIQANCNREQDRYL